MFFENLQFIIISKISNRRLYNVLQGDIAESDEFLLAENEHAKTKLQNGPYTTPTYPILT